MSSSKNRRVEVDYMEGYGEWFRLWTMSSHDAELLQKQCQEFLADLFGLDVSVQLFEVERSGCMVIVRWFYVEDIKEALDSVVYTEIGWKDMVFHTPEGENAYYLANYFKRILPIALFEVKKWGTTVKVTGKPYKMSLPYDIIDWDLGGEVIIEAHKEFELTPQISERVLHMCKDDDYEEIMGFDLLEALNLNTREYMELEVIRAADISLRGMMQHLLEMRNEFRRDA